MSISKKVNSINTISCILSKYGSFFSVLVFDKEGFVWVETFAKSRKKASKKAVCFFSIACKMY